MLKPYEGYKETDQLWLEKVSNQWDMVKIKHLFNERIEKGYPNEPLLVASQNMGVVPKGVYGSRTVEATKDLHLLKLVKIEDFVISLRSFQGGIEYAYYQGIISPAYTVMTSKCNLSPNYFKYLAKSKVFIELLQMCVTGIREGQNIDYSKLKNYKLPVPSQAEQDQIVRYLDWQTAKITKLINAKKKQIELLKEQKQAVIENTLYGDYKFKRIRLSISTIKIGSGKTPRGGSAVYSNSGILFIRSQNVHCYAMNNENAYYISDEINNSMISTAVKKGDVLLNITGGSIGRSCVYNLDLKANVNQHVCIIRPNAEILLSKYLCYILNSMYGQDLIEQCQNAGNRESLTFVQIGQFGIPIPKIEEQQAIVTYLEEKTALIDKAIAVIEKEIELVSEYKTSLISSVVTGKIDVRNVVVPEFEIVEVAMENNEDGEIEMEEEY